MVTSETVQKSRTPAGRETPRSASVVVPRSYFVGIYRRANRKQGQAGDPDDALLQPVVDAHLAKIRGLVKNALGLERDEDVTAESYDDAGSPAAMAAAPLPPNAAPNAATVAAVTAVPNPSAALLKANPQQIALAVLLVMTVVLFSMLMRKRAGVNGVPATVAMSSSAPASRGAIVLSGTLESPAQTTAVPGVPGATPADEADAHRMFHRVRDVVGENPDDAARVLREWIYQGR